MYTKNAMTEKNCTEKTSRHNFRLYKKTMQFSIWRSAWIITFWLFIPKTFKTRNFPSTGGRRKSAIPAYIIIFQANTSLSLF